ncbi:hypothetical protein [Candidatus Vondammii sp. HM_W22]|uniref:hypothetical protein n=1 Tax=Candidatus Vondammii sp. HM_W22 TaxID=2687299 RepID=UPI002E7BFA4D|nr:hypothetical protein [Candidatus Vondammii sp. HM_W22]
MTGKAQRKWQSFTAAIMVSLLLADCASMATQQLSEYRSGRRMTDRSRRYPMRGRSSVEVKKGHLNNSSQKFGP